MKSVKKRERLPLGWRPLIGILLLGQGAAVDAAEPLRMHATIDLREGSRIVGDPTEETLAVVTSHAAFDLPLDRVRDVIFPKSEEGALVRMKNGDLIKGKITGDGFPITSVLGDLVIPWTQVERLGITFSGGPLLPAGDGPLAFGGVKWNAMRVEAEGQGDKLATLPRARPGFLYGHSGHGRGATIATNVGHKDWQDYRVEYNIVLTGVNPAFNPHRVPANEIGVSLLFHVADLKESWNEKGRSCYAFTMAANGSWGISCVYNHHCPGERGYRKPVHDGYRKIASGDGITLANQKNNHVVLEVEGQRIRVWVNDQQLVEVTDEKMDEELGGVTLDHGGVAIQWGYEGMGWISDFSATRL